MNLDSFIPSEGAEGGGIPLEILQERMKRNAAFIAAVKKAEQKQKKSEDSLVKILIKLIKKSKHPVLLPILSKLLALNTPAYLLLSFLMLIEEEEIVDEINVLLLGTNEKSLINKDMNIKEALEVWINTILKLLEKENNILILIIQKHGDYYSKVLKSYSYEIIKIYFEQNNYTKYTEESIDRFCDDFISQIYDKLADNNKPELLK